MRAAIQTFDKMERLDNMDAVEAETKEYSRRYILKTERI